MALSSPLSPPPPSVSPSSSAEALGQADLGPAYTAIRASIASAEQASNRPPSSVRLLAVSKGQSAEAIARLAALGHLDFGENRLEEAQAKFPALKRDFPALRLHFIGHLQRRKIQGMVALCDTFHALDRLALIEPLARAADSLGKKLPCFIQVNLGREPQKSGVLPEDLPALVDAVRQARGLALEGFMVLPPHSAPPEPYFEELGASGEAIWSFGALHGHESRLSGCHPSRSDGGPRRDGFIRPSCLTDGRSVFDLIFLSQESKKLLKQNSNSEDLMELTIKLDSLRDALGHVGGAVERQTPMEIISHILLEAKAGGGLTITGNDTYLEMSQELEEANVKKTRPGDAFARAFCGPGGKTPQRERNDAHPRRDNAARASSVRARQCETSPRWTRITFRPLWGARTFSVQSDVSSQIVSQTDRVALARDEFGYLASLSERRLSGVGRIQPAALRGCDGWGIVWAAIRCRSGIKTSPTTRKSLFRKRTVLLLGSMLAAAHDGQELAVGLSESRINFRLGTRTLCSTLVDGRYPGLPPSHPRRRQI